MAMETLFGTPDRSFIHWGARHEVATNTVRVNRGLGRMTIGPVTIQGADVGVFQVRGVEAPLVRGEFGEVEPFTNIN